jgi:polar amino acid transport system permease protein
LDSLPKLLEGLQVTFLLTVVAITAGFILGISLALGRIYGNKVISSICIGFIEVVRGTPLLVQLFIIYFGLPSIGIVFSPLHAALLGLSINSGAYQAEYLRGSIQAIPAGQMIAARTLGMSKIRSIQTIVLPQALRISIPAWSNELIYLFKYTSIAYIIQVKELTAEGQIIASRNFRYVEIYLIIALIYLVFTFIISEIVDRTEKRLRIPGIGLPQRIGWLRNA